MINSSFAPAFPWSGMAHSSFGFGFP